MLALCKYKTVIQKLKPEDYVTRLKSDDYVTYWIAWHVSVHDLTTESALDNGDKMAQKPDFLAFMFETHKNKKK